MSKSSKEKKGVIHFTGNTTKTILTDTYGDPSMLALALHKAANSPFVSGESVISLLLANEGYGDNFGRIALTDYQVIDGFCYHFLSTELGSEHFWEGDSTSFNKTETTKEYLLNLADGTIADKSEAKDKSIADFVNEHLSTLAFEELNSKKSTSSMLDFFSSYDPVIQVRYEVAGKALHGLLTTEKALQLSEFIGLFLANNEYLIDKASARLFLDAKKDLERRSTETKNQAIVRDITLPAQARLMVKTGK